MFDTGLIEIFRGDDTDGLGYQTINGVVDTDIDLTGCTLTFRYLDFTQTFTYVSSGDTLTITMSSAVTKTFPPGLGFASVRVTDSQGKLRTFNNRIPVIVKTSTPCVGGGSFHINFKKFPKLEPLKIFTGGTSYTEYTGYIQRIINKATATQYGLAMLYDGINSTDGASTGKAATPAAVHAVVQKLTDEYYNADDVDEMLADKLKSVVVSELPSEGDGNTIYLVPSTTSGVYDAFMWIDGSWGRIGTSSGGTSDYAALSNKPQINGTTLQGGNNTLTGADIPVSASDATKVDAALAGKRGLADFGVGGLPVSASCYCTLSIDGSEPVASTYNSATRWEGVIFESHTWGVFLSNGAYTLAESYNLRHPVSIAFDSTYTATLTSGGHTYVVKAYADTLALSSSVPTVGTSLTFATTTAVTGGTIWSHIWGALTAIPDSAASLYAWITAKFAQYLPLSGGTMTGELVIPPSGNADISIGNTFNLGYESPSGVQFYLKNDAAHNHLLIPISGIKTIATTDQIPTVPTNVSAFTNDAGYIKIPATRYAIVALGSSTSLTNAAYNTDIAAAITTAKTYTLPAPVFDASNNRQVRDLYLYADVGTGGSVTFASTDAASNPLTFVSDDFSALAAEDGLNAWLLSEVAANTFLVKRLALTTGTLPTANA